MGSNFFFRLQPFVPFPERAIAQDDAVIASLCFLVRRVLSARATKLLCLHALGVLLLVFCRGVVPVLALTTLQRNDFPHFLNSFLQARAGLGRPACTKITR
jgi:hypothetical protein